MSLILDNFDFLHRELDGPGGPLELLVASGWFIRSSQSKHSQRLNGAKKENGPRIATSKIASSGYSKEMAIFRSGGSVRWVEIVGQSMKPMCSFGCPVEEHVFITLFP